MEDIMRAYKAVAALIGVTLLGCDDDDPAGPDLVTLHATMTGAAEFPGPGDTDGTGTAEITLNDDTNEVCWVITVANITLPAIAAHIHPGAAGTAGNPVVSLTAPDATGGVTGCVDSDDATVDAIIANPSAFYVNVHTTDFTGGAVRGQLTN
jgi:hypothetical protein